MDIIKYTPLFPIYYLLGYGRRGDMIKTLVGNLGILIFMSLATIENKSTKLETNGNGTTYKISNSDGVKIDLGVDEALQELKDEYYKSLKEERDEEIEYTEVVRKIETAEDRFTTPMTDKASTMAEEYYQIISYASDKTGVPLNILMGVSVMEGGTFYTKTPPIPGSSIPSNLYGEDGMNFKTYGIKEIEKGYGDRAGGKTDASHVSGPFKMGQDSWAKYGEDVNGDGLADRHNLVDASVGAGNMLMDYYNYIDNEFHNTQEQAKWLWVMGAYNAGKGGMLARVPLDSLEDFIDDELTSITEDKTLHSMVYENLITQGRGWGLRKPIVEFWDSKGWKMDEKMRNQVETKIQDVNLKQDLGTSNPGGTWSASLSGDRYGQRYETSRSNDEVISKGDGLNRISMNMETMEYLIAGYSAGIMVEKELKSRIEIQSSRVKPNTNDNGNNNSVMYYWKQDRMTSNASREVKEYTTGKIGEVGWKGNFPIFIQKEGARGHSKTPWKFNGRDTTLGRSGCSIYSITSMVHGSGLGEYLIPNTNLEPTLENFAKVFPNGPVIFSDVKKQGYEIDVKPTATKKQLDELFSNIEAGIPYIINTRNGTVKALDVNRNEIETQFTSGGHFLIMVSGYKIGDKRYVEVVQSSRSYGATKGDNTDQNQMAFDFGHLVRNNILRSSFGSPVPAYTIIGIKGNGENNLVKASKFLEDNYTSPRELSIDNDKYVTERTRVIKDKIKRIKPENKNSQFVESITDKYGNTQVGIDLILKDNALVSYENGNNVIIYIDYVNAILITDVEETQMFSGKMKKGDKVGKTTDISKYHHLLRTEDGNWINLKENIEVTSD